MQWKTSRPPFPLASPPLARTAGRPQSSSSSSWPAREADLRPPDDPHLRTGRLVTVPSWVCLWLPGGPSPQLFSPGPAMGERRRELTWERERERVISNTMGDNRRASILDILRGRNKENKRDQPASSERWVLLLIVNFSFRVALSRWLSLSSVVQLSLISSMLDILFLNSLDF